jgi:hypothetical protein
VLVELALCLVLIELFCLNSFEQFACDEIHMALLAGDKMVLPEYLKVVAVRHLPMEPRHLGSLIVQVLT